MSYQQLTDRTLRSLYAEAGIAWITLRQNLHRLKTMLNEAEQVKAEQAFNDIGVAVLFS